MMQWAVEYQLRGLLRLYLFRAENEEGAKLYVQYMCKLDRTIVVTRLEPLPPGATVADLYRLFPSTGNEREHPAKLSEGYLLKRKASP